MTVTILTLASNPSSRKAVKFLQENNIQMNEKRISFLRKMDFSDFMKILELTENGFDDIVAVKSKAYQNLGIDINDLNKVQVYNLICENPTIMKAPIIFNDRKLVVGYGEEIRIFIPRAEKYKTFFMTLEKVRKEEKYEVAI
jgi:regulatory protein spx